MKRAFLFLAVAILYCNFTLAQEPDPDPNLLWKTENGYNSFVIHPNGNIIASKGLAVTELNGNTGEVIREFPFYFEFYALSRDGKYLAGGIDSLIVIDYETGEIVKKLDVESSSRVDFMPDNERLLIRTSYEESEKQFCLYNYITDEKSFFGVGSNIGIWNFTISPDGKFLAIGGFIFHPGGENQTILLLYDAVTWKPIKNLATIDADNEVNSIKFSPDSRFVGFGLNGEHLHVYNIENLSLHKYYDSAFGFGFFTNDFITIVGASLKPLFLKIVQLGNNEIIYTKKKFSGYPEHNETNNSMVLLNEIIHCYDFEKIFIGASIDTENLAPFTFEYKDKTLHIKNPNFKSSQITGQIADLNGKIIRELEFNKPTCNLPIPLELLSGTYFLHIKDGGKEYVSKFWVVN
ncbi:MAG: hypothetical protein CVV22_05645 [Ignavibacteriae bacterium HGW-Ignavibacteriae-1]|jgi:hypothetical protein|nr:MAG: hypothetical protein CVV22_05645 [Ignavibacteriae bacterium HGW-Ignavibacteriae-1]